MLVTSSRSVWIHVGDLCISMQGLIIHTLIVSIYAKISLRAWCPNTSERSLLNFVLWCPKLYANAIQVDKSLKKMFEHQYIFSKKYDVQRLMSFHFWMFTTLCLKLSTIPVKTVKCGPAPFNKPGCSDQISNSFQFKFSF